jgi:hypothetical protein
MSHLILAIALPGFDEIPGTEPVCVNQGGSTPPWRTVSIYDGTKVNLIGSEDSDTWELLPDEDQNADGNIQFATCCLWKATVRWSLESSDAFYEGRISINGTEIHSWFVEGSAGEVVDFVVDLDELGLMGRACGNIWDIFGSFYTGDGGQYMTIQIIDVEFGPPI